MTLFGEHSHAVLTQLGTLAMEVNSSVINLKFTVIYSSLRFLAVVTEHTAILTYSSTRTRMGTRFQRRFHVFLCRTLASCHIYLEIRDLCAIDPS